MVFHEGRCYGDGMNDTTTAAEDAARRARHLLEADTERRVEAVRVVAQSAADSDAAEHIAAEKRAAHEKAWTAAIAAGWSERDLRATGARAPGNRARSTRRKTAGDRGDATLENA